VLAHDIKECGARILDKMPTISDLDGLWCAFGRRFAVAGTTVARVYAVRAYETELGF
jgi:hypothetical protein